MKHKRIVATRSYWMQLPLLPLIEGAQRPNPPQRSVGGAGRAALPPSANRGGKSQHGTEAEIQGYVGFVEARWLRDMRVNFLLGSQL